jgi:hypothetical protein
LDVTSSNPFLESYYVNRGFEHCQTVEIFGDRCVLLQKAITLTVSDCEDRPSEA